MARASFFRGSLGLANTVSSSISVFSEAANTANSSISALLEAANAVANSISAFSEASDTANSKPFLRFQRLQVL